TSAISSFRKPGFTTTHAIYGFCESTYLICASVISGDSLYPPGIILVEEEKVIFVLVKPCAVRFALITSFISFKPTTNLVVLPSLNFASDAFIAAFGSIGFAG